MIGGNFAPVGWAFCDGQLMPISENDALFTLIGTMYGGDGQDTFALPDLRGRAPMHFGTSPFGTNRQIAEQAGVEQVTLTVNQIPNHTHTPTYATTGQVQSPDNAILAAPRSTQAGVRLFATNQPPDVTFPATTIVPTGQSQPHENMQPFLTINYIIALYGIFPSPT
jgi:microcystin-dependent protein